MTAGLLARLCDPKTSAVLSLLDARYDDHGLIVSGRLVSETGGEWPICDGVPRFADPGAQRAVESFGNQWNHFNFTQFREHWQAHTVASTFGSTEVFRDKVIVDAGGGSGAQTVWMLESGARHVVMLELSHSVDDVVRRNLSQSGFLNVDVVQCSIDEPPIRARSIDGIVLCHNVIQHTPSVERTAHALFNLVAPGGEFVFNCYPKNDEGWARWIRVHLISDPLRAVLSRSPFWVIHSYARLAAAARLVPLLGDALEKSGLAVQGDVPGAGRGVARLRRRYRATELNTFDKFGSHAYQHLKSDDEIRTLVSALQPDPAKVLNLGRYFERPKPVGCAIRVFR